MKPDWDNQFAETEDERNARLREKRLSQPKAKERFCWNCGASMGVIENRYYDSGDTCGATECDREARYQAEAERAEAHEQLDRDMGW